MEKLSTSPEIRHLHIQEGCWAPHWAASSLSSLGRGSWNLRTPQLRLHVEFLGRSKGHFPPLAIPNKFDMGGHTQLHNGSRVCQAQKIFKNSIFYRCVVFLFVILRSFLGRKLYLFLWRRRRRRKNFVGFLFAKIAKTFRFSSKLRGFLWEKFWHDALSAQITKNTFSENFEIGDTLPGANFGLSKKTCFFGVF